MTTTTLEKGPGVREASTAMRPEPEGRTFYVVTVGLAVTMGLLTVVAVAALVASQVFQKIQ